MKAFTVLALLGAISAIRVNRADLPYDEAADKIDPLSRYVNDEDIV